MSRSESGPDRPSSRRPSTLGATLGLDALGIVLFVAAVLIVRQGGPRDTSDEGFFSDPLPAVLMLLTASALAVAGVLAAVSLVRAPLRSRVGRWAMWMGVAASVLMPVVAASVMIIAWLAGYDLPEGWGEPIAPVWQVAALAAIGLGLAAKEPGRRGLLILPIVIAAALLIFILGDAPGGPFES